jgi:iron-sulfur cluster repair protein YtfE (RIC family)
MTTAMSDPVRRFEHSHATLTKLALEIREIIRGEALDGLSPAGIKIRKQLVTRLDLLREELLQHFANEEEGLFPFVRLHVTAKAGAVDRLADAHDAICGAIVRLGHLVERDPEAPKRDRAALVSHYERFETAYALHSQEEAALFEELGRTLDAGQREELTEILRGL